MTAALIFASVFSFAAALINFGEIRRDPRIKGWVFGFGLLAGFGFGLWAIARECCK